MSNPDERAHASIYAEVARLRADVDALIADRAETLVAIDGLVHLMHEISGTAKEAVSAAHKAISSADALEAQQAKVLLNIPIQDFRRA